jgi:hypothetical protein
VDRHADRARLVGERPRDGLADPPRGIGRELVAAAPVELLDRPDEPERALLDQVEEGQALVAVVLGDRDHEPEVRLDHALLGGAFAALDPLRELDLLRGSEQRVAAGLAEEELERVGGRLVAELLDDRGRWRGRLLLVLEDLDAPALELAEERVDLEGLELLGLDELDDLRLAHGAARLGGLEQDADVLQAEELLDVRSHHLVAFPARGSDPNARSSRKAPAYASAIPSARPAGSAGPTHDNRCYVKSGREACG